MSKIKVMDEILANKIAAGEVVERCSSVVKELVENSIDAGSTEIKVDLIDSGVKQIKVTDNGIGMDEEDAPLAFSRHATSKLKTEEDLFHINTLGFRGEALASIASVSEIELKTSNGLVGTVIKLSGGKITSTEKSDLRKGTTITVCNLFYNTPARLKHLKSLYAELSYVTEYMNKLSLSHPDIRFSLSNNGSNILKTDGSNDLLKTIAGIYGIETAKKMIKVTAEDNDYIIDGFISLPEVHRSSRNHMITIVNGRVVKNMELNRIINDSYHSYKPDNRYPITVLNISLDSTLADVNVHPTKMDIKFSKFEELKDLISDMIKEAIGKKNLIPEVYINEEDDNEIKDKKPKYEELTLDLERVKEDEPSYEKRNSENVVKEIKEEIKEEKQITKNTEEKIIEDSKEVMPEIYPIGVVHGTYIVCENEKGMYLIDQHAAKERINYEIVKEKLSNPSNKSIGLLLPITIELTPNEFLNLKENLFLLTNMGFEIEEFGINSIIVKQHPIWIKDNEEEIVKNIIELVIQKEKNFDLSKFNDHLAATMACKMSIKANDRITLEEMENLISDLRKCHNPYNCPHGRPTMIFYSNYDLEKLFKRSGFDQII